MEIVFNIFYAPNSITTFTYVKKYFWYFNKLFECLIYKSHNPSLCTAQISILQMSLLRQSIVLFSTVPPTN